MSNSVFHAHNGCESGASSNSNLITAGFVFLGRFGSDFSKGMAIFLRVTTQLDMFPEWTNCVSIGTPSVFGKFPFHTSYRHVFIVNRATHHTVNFGSTPGSSCPIMRLRKAFVDFFGAPFLVEKKGYPRLPRLPLDHPKMDRDQGFPCNRHVWLLKFLKSKKIICFSQIKLNFL